MAEQLEAEKGDTTTLTLGALREHLLQICERFADAERRAWRARVRADAGALDAAETERWEAAGDYHAACLELADLPLLLLRHALDHRREALRDLLLDLLTDDIANIALAAGGREAPRE